MADWYYYDAEGRKKGPYSGNQIKELLKEGTVTPDTLVEDPGGHTRPVKEVIGLTFWYYYDNDGRKKGPFTNEQLIELVKQGLVTRETILENEKGQTGPARRIKALPFPPLLQPVPPQPVEPNPFVFTPQESDNPFAPASQLPNQNFNSNPYQQSQPVVVVQESQALAAIMSFFFGGIGQLVQGRVAAGLLWLFNDIILGGTLLLMTFGVGLVFTIPSRILCIVDAAVYKPRTGKELGKFVIVGLCLNSGGLLCILLFWLLIFLGIAGSVSSSNPSLTPFDLGAGRQGFPPPPIDDPYPQPPQKTQEQIDMERAVSRADTALQNAARNVTEARSSASAAARDASEAGSVAATEARDEAAKAVKDVESASDRAANAARDARNASTSSSATRAAGQAESAARDASAAASTARNQARIAADELATAKNRQTQEERKLYAERVFSQVSLDFSKNYQISEALQFYNSSRSREFALELRGERSEEVAEASQDGDWLKMVSLLEGQYFVFYPEAKILDSAFEKLQSGDKAQMLLKGNFVGLPLEQIYILGFRNFETVCRSANFNNVQNPADLGNWSSQNGWIVQNYGNLEEGVSRYDGPWKQHPNGAGYYRGFWPLSEKNRYVIGDHVVVTRRCFVLQINRNGVNDYCNNLNNTMKGVVIRLRERIKLGEITPDQAEPLLESEYNRILAEALERARKR